MDSEEHNRFVTKLSPPFGDLALNSELFSIEFARLIGWYRQNDLNMRSRNLSQHFFLMALGQWKVAIATILLGLCTEHHPHDTCNYYTS